MKNTLKNTTGSLTLKIDELTDGGAVTLCHNLLADNRSGRRVLTVAPGLQSLGQGFAKPLASYRDTQGRAHNLFSFKSDEIESGWLIESDGERHTGSTRSPLICGVATTGGFIVMTANGSMRLNLDDGEWTMTDDSILSTEGIRLSAEETGTVTTRTNPLTIKDVDIQRSDSIIGKSGLSQLSSALIDAYTDLAAIACAGGQWIQPMVARYHLLDAQGHRHYSSSPMIMCSENGWQCAAEISTNISVNTDGHLQLPSIPLTASTYRLHLTVNKDDATRLQSQGIVAIEIETTPQIHPLDTAEQAAYRLVRPTSYTPTLTVALPGATTHFSRRNEMRRTMLQSLSVSLDSAATSCVRVNVEGNPKALSLRRTSFRSPSEEIALITKALSAGASAATQSSADRTLIGRISSPNRFTANTVAAMGDTIVWGDITPLSTTRINIYDICGMVTNRSFTGVLTVGMTDGSRRRFGVEGQFMPTAWAPSVSYPDASATSLTIDLLGNDGTRLTGTIALESDGSGARASSIDIDLKWRELEKTTGPLPEAGENASESERHQGAVVACRLTAPLTPIASTECCHSPVLALHPAVGSQSSWDFSRCHLYAMTSFAIYAVAVNIDRLTASASLIDQRGIDHGGAAVRTPKGIMALHRGQLLKVSTSRVETVDTGLTATDIAWDPALQRLWMLDADGNITLLSPADGRSVSLASPADFRSIDTIDNRVWLTDTDELYCVEPSTPGSALRPVAWQSAADLPCGSRPTAMEIRASASSFNGTIRVMARNAPGCELRSVATLRLHGSLKAPIRCRLPAPVRPYLDIAIEGTASADFQLHSITITYHETHR